MSGTESEENQTNDVESSSRDEIRAKISQMSFAELQKLKEEIGSKVYAEKFLGAKTKKKMPSRETFKRENKNRPREMSSKIPPRSSKPDWKPGKNEPRDPRFDPMCGTFNEKLFKKSYEFVDELKEKERIQLKEQLSEVTDEKQRKKIKYLIQRLDNQLREKRKREEAESKERARQKDEPNAPYQRKSERKMMALLNQYEDLKKSKKLEKHIKRKSKKLSKKSWTAT